MFKMLGQMWEALAMLFSAAYRGANALDHCAQWAEKEAIAFEKRTDLERKAKMKELEHRLKALPTPAKEAA